MCKPTTTTTSEALPPPDARLFLATVKDFGEDEYGRTPTVQARLFTIGVFVVFLIGVEQLCRQILLANVDFHPLLENETNRHILARHVGIDFVSAAVVSYFGFNARHLTQDMIDKHLRGKKNAMPKTYENRLFQYHPESARIILLFIGYQVKNSYDTLVWNDGALFIAHHILAFGTAWGALFPGAAHYYAPFYLGYSEISTAALCLLANFDDDFGVRGLAAAFPLTKVILGAIFAVSFIVCRVIIWTTHSVYYLQDVIACLKTDDPRIVGRKPWLQFTGFSLSLLSLLQIIWLGEIFLTGKRELEAMGFL
ncbi:unnamed protein product [Cylindrotheca closterium]|uniref:TLC domain-containing protein n=1 Tax=Cylindrotheca closterium TaxID=2856 RepID=A0AAD2FHS2_9STRA|nr:unnamed protein product [Cylindrotheca closterium]